MFTPLNTETDKETNKNGLSRIMFRCSRHQCCSHFINRSLCYGVFTLARQDLG